MFCFIASGIAARRVETRQVEAQIGDKSPARRGDAHKKRLPPRFGYQILLIALQVHRRNNCFAINHHNAQKYSAEAIRLDNRFIL